MLTSEELTRMEHAKKTTGETNCIGTALYILGKIPEDSYVGLWDKRWEEGIVSETLKSMDQVKKPKRGDLLVITDSVREDETDQIVVHLGIVLAKSNPKVYHRPGIGKIVIPDEPLRSVINRYRECALVEYFRKRP